MKLKCSVEAEIGIPSELEALLSREKILERVKSQLLDVWDAKFGWVLLPRSQVEAPKQELDENLLGKLYLHFGLYKERLGTSEGYLKKFDYAQRGSVVDIIEPPIAVANLRLVEDIDALEKELKGPVSVKKPSVQKLLDPYFFTTMLMGLESVEQDGAVGNLWIDAPSGTKVLDPSGLAESLWYQINTYMQEDPPNIVVQFKDVDPSKIEDPIARILYQLQEWRFKRRKEVGGDEMDMKFIPVVKVKEDFKLVEDYT